MGSAGIVVAATLLLVFSSQGISASGQSFAEHPLVGAYYYLWNPENFAGGTLRAHLTPPQLPAASLVNSQSPRTARRDIANASQAGINFFAIDWWPYDPGYSGADYRTGRRGDEGLSGRAKHREDALRHVLRDVEPGLQSRQRVHPGHVPDGAALRLRHGSPSQATTSTTLRTCASMDDPWSSSI